MKTWAILFLNLVSCLASAGAPSMMTFQSKIIAPSGVALEAASVNFRFTIYDSAGTCVLYVEDYANVNMTGSKGVVNISLGSGVKAYPPAAVSLYEVFNNMTASYNCQAGGTSSPAATDNRQVVMQFNDGSGWQTLPQMAINAVPFANYATRAENLGAYAATAYLRPSTLPTCTGGQVLTWDGTVFTCVAGGGGGGVTSVSGTAPIVVTGTSTPVVSLPKAGAAANGYLSSTDWSTFNNKANIVIGAGKIYLGNASGDATGVSLSGDATLAATGILTLADTGVVAGSYGSATRIPVLVVDSKGRLTSATSTPISISSNDVTTALGYTPVSNGAIFANGGNSFGAAANLGTNDGYALNFKTNNITRVTIDSSGNVGIGTTSPTEKLELRRQDGSIPQAIKFANTTGNDWLIFQPLFNDDLQIYSLAGAGINVMSFGSTSGYVGIGTTTPSGILHVDGGTASADGDASAITLQAQNARGPSNSKGGDIVLQTGSAFGAHYDGTLRLLTGTGGIFLDYHNGNQTYASSNAGWPQPQDYPALQMYNSAFADNEMIQQQLYGRNAAGNEQMAYFGVYTTSGAGSFTPVMVWGQRTGNNSYSERMRIDTAGNLAVGTTTPGARLDVVDTSTTTSGIIVPRAGNFTGTNVNGMIRYNTASTLFEFRQNGAWVNYTTVSDARLKTNVTPVVHGLDIVNQLNPVFYDWDRTNPKASGFEEKHQVGFIAQEVEKILPEVVNKGEDSYRSVEYGKIVSVVVAAVQEIYKDLMNVKANQNSQAREIASKVDKQEVDLLKTENAQLKKEIATIKAYLCAKDTQADFCNR